MMMMMMISTAIYDDDDDDDNNHGATICSNAGILQLFKISMHQIKITNTYCASCFWHKLNKKAQIG